MNDIVTWTALATHETTDANNRVADFLDKFVDKIPLVAAGILLILVAAVTSGALTASVVFGG